MTGLNRLNRYHRLRVSGGEGVHVGEDEVAGAVVVGRPTRVRAFDGLRRAGRRL